jgi:RNA polymerase sigma-70 factor (ECF subfamily)
MFSESEKLRHQLLAMRCRRGDEEAWRELIAAWEPKLLYYILRLVNQEQDAWDVLQQTWLSAYQNIRRLTDLRLLPSWLYSIARNKAIDHRRLRIPETLDAKDCESISDLEQREVFDDVESVHLALDQLTIAHREAITLYFLEDLSVNEIAQVLEIPAGTVKSRLHNAKRELHSILERQAQS